MIGPAATDGADVAVTAASADGERPAAITTVAGWVLVSAVAGFVIGLIWTVAAPRVQYTVGGGELVRVASQPEEFFGADLLLGSLLACAGLASAVWWVVRIRAQPLASMLGMAIGGVIAGIIAAFVGQVLTATTLSADGLAEGVTVTAGLQMRSWAMVLWWPAWAAIVLGVITIWHGGELLGVGAKGYLAEVDGAAEAVVAGDVDTVATGEAVPPGAGEADTAGAGSP